MSDKLAKLPEVPEKYRREKLSWEDERLVMEAEAAGDTIMVTSFEPIRWALIYEIAMESMSGRSVNLKAFAKRHNVGLARVRKMRKGMGFSADLKRFMRDQVLARGNGQLLADAHRKLHQAVNKGDMRAITLALKLEGEVGGDDGGGGDV